jgi:Cys-tRNA(Pro) deacylase
MTKENIPTTPALLALKAQDADFTMHTYPYEERGGTKRAAGKLMVDEHRVIKTLVMEDEKGKPLIILMHGDKEVSTKSLARAIGTKSVSPCNPAIAEKHTGYKVGGTSPFGTKKIMPVPICRKFLLTREAAVCWHRSPPPNLFEYLNRFLSVLLYNLPFDGKKEIMAKRFD